MIGTILLGLMLTKRISKEMNFLAYDSAPLKDLVAHLKNNPKSRGNAWIIGLYRSFMGETIHKNDIAIN
jgi:hypothetical protein